MDELVVKWFDATCCARLRYTLAKKSSRLGCATTTTAGSCWRGGRRGGRPGRRLGHSAPVDERADGQIVFGSHAHFSVRAATTIHR